MNDPEFWHNKWASNKIGFHLHDVNPLLTQFWSVLEPQREESVLVPLCGKSEDLVWLAERHNEVVGVELSQIAVRAFFAEHFYTPLVTQLGNHHELYQFDELSLYTGDFFTAPVDKVDLIYDRAALVALPPEMRVAYAERIKLLLKPGGRMLLVSLDYPQEELAGPPFSVAEQEICELFDGLKVTLLDCNEESAKGPQRAKKGLSRFAETVWLIES